MRLLLDAHISRPIMQYLESIGHDCTHAALLSPKMSDRAILERAVRERRVVMTADKDFGELVFRGQFAVAGVVLLRFRLMSEAERTA
jgi:predicted nuclease of predicted toxin-antitoxin system